MNPKLIKKNIVMEIIRKKNNFVQEANISKNNYFVHFLVLSIFLIAILLLIYKYYEKKDSKINKKQLNKNED